MRTCSARALGMVFFLGSFVTAWVDAADIPLKNWPAPVTWSASRSGYGATTMDLGNPIPFIGLQPCRLLDTRGNGAPFTGGKFTGGSDVRSYTLPQATICGIPASVAAVSLNFTVVNPD